MLMRWGRDTLSGDGKYCTHHMFSPKIQTPLCIALAFSSLRKPSEIFPLLLCYHAGSESSQEFCLYCFPSFVRFQICIAAAVGFLREVRAMPVPCVAVGVYRESENFAFPPPLYLNVAFRRSENRRRRNPLLRRNRTFCQTC